MWAFFLIVVGVCTVIPVAAFVFLKGVNWKEFGCILLANLIVAGCSAGITSCASKHDTEILSGRVTGKSRDKVSCSHSYDCNPYPCNCDSKGRCSTCYHTCYEHSYDVDWDVQTTVGGFTIDRVDRQGLDKPPRWAATVIGEPVVNDHSYENFVKASPGTLFRHQGLMEKYAQTLPDNPQNIYDYWHLNRLVTVGVTPLEPATDWNNALMELNADLGASKQANIIVVLVKNVPDDWYYALEEKWIGGKKNDVVLVASVDDNMKPQWATVMCWTTNELFKVKLRDDVMNDPQLTKDAVMQDLRTNVTQYFQRKPMHDFQYLEAEMQPSTTAWVVTLIIALLVSIGLTVFFEFNDVFDDGDEDDEFVTNFKRSRRRRYGYY